MSWQTVVGDVLVLVGAGLVVSAALGMLRLPDLYNRTNAVSKAAALGVSCVLIGVMVLVPEPRVVITLTLAIAAQLFTAPIAGYAVGRAGYRAGTPLAGSTHRDDLAAPGHRRGPDDHAAGPGSPD